jgi:very-short-patch-repair endonuclease
MRRHGTCPVVSVPSHAQMRWVHNSAGTAGETHRVAPCTRNRARQRDVPVDLAIVRLAATQHRIITWPQLLEIGLSARAVAHRVATGRLHRVHRGVYLLEPPGTADRITLLAAAVCSCGAGAVLSHYAAAELWGLLSPEPGAIDVTMVRRNPGARPAVSLHRPSMLDERDVRVRQGLRVTAPARVALELATHLDAGRLEELLARTRVECSMTDSDVAATLHRYPAYPGTGILRAAMARDHGPSLTRSSAERRLLDLIRRAGLQPPSTNVRTGRYEVDFLWPDSQLVVEVDGYAFHHDRAAFERDRRKDAALLAAGLRVMRFTWRQIVEEPLTVVARIAQVLGSSRG